VSQPVCNPGGGTNFRSAAFWPRDEARLFGENSMRVLFGIILGVALTVSVAFISDSWSAGPTTTGSSSATIEHRQMVNWDVVSENVRIARERLHSAWNRLSRKIDS
jgi:hypothetical protein